MSLPRGACALVFNSQGQVLVVTRPGCSEHVCMPGGKLEEGETFQEAAVRETTEESGVVAAGHRLVQVYRAPCVGDENVPLFDVAMFLLLDPLTDIPGSLETDVEARWAPLSVLLEASPFADYNRDGLHAVLAALPLLAARGLMEASVTERIGHAIESLFIQR